MILIAVFLLMGPTMVSAATLRVDPTPKHPVSDLIYGQNAFYSHENVSTSRIPHPIVRFGGNAISRYNWQTNSYNAGKDWYFLNIPMDNRSGQQLPLGSRSDDVFRRANRQGSRVFLNLPLLGWVSKDRSPSYSYSKKKYGDQQSYEPFQAAKDAGNGLKTNGDIVKNNDPRDASKPVNASWSLRWLRHIKSTYPNLPLILGLGNEPTLWDETHRDIRYGDRSLPSASLGYDELWEKTKTLAVAIKRRYPQALLAGPGSWGWCGYFGSGRDRTDNIDGCTGGRDRKLHGDQALLPWYLEQVCRHQKKSGVRLIDYLAVHFYPEEFDPSQTSSANSQRRYQRLRALYDTSYPDPSWIKAPIALIPRLQEMIRRHCPGTKLALTEYRFGTSQDSIDAVLAQVIALGIFAKHRLDLATHFHEIESNSLLEQGFRLFLNYDGKGKSLLQAKYFAVQSNDKELHAFGYLTKSGKQVLVINTSGKSKPIRWTNGSGFSAVRMLSKKGLGPWRGQPRQIPPKSAVIFSSN